MKFGAHKLEALELANSLLKGPSGFDAGGALPSRGRHYGEATDLVRSALRRAVLSPFGLGTRDWGQVASFQE